MAAARGFFDQYSVFCVFGSVVGCVVVPLITQSFESLIFSAIVITLTANRLSKRILANEQKSGHQRDGVDRRRVLSQTGLALGKKRKKAASLPQTTGFGYEELKRRREEELKKEEEARVRDMKQREEDRREKKARKKMERKERREQERISREKEEEEKQKRHEARFLQRRPKSSSENAIETISSWRDQPVQRASSTSSIASSSSSNSSIPAPLSPPQHTPAAPLRPQTPPTQNYRKNRRLVPPRPWYLPSRPVLKPCSVSYDASGPSLTAPPPPPTSPDDHSTWVASPRKAASSSPETISALKIDTVEPSQLTTEDLQKAPVYDSPFTDPLPPFNATDPFGFNENEFSSQLPVGDEHPGPRLYSLFGRETKSPMFGQLVGSETI